jgi:hypothetical protein
MLLKMGLVVMSEERKVSLGRSFGGLFGFFRLAGVAGAGLKLFSDSGISERSAGTFALGSSLVTSTH